MDERCYAADEMIVAQPSAKLFAARLVLREEREVEQLLELDFRLL
jgi:hypothetical protein